MRPRRRRALLLACARFTDPALPPLRSPRRDAEALSEVLAGAGAVGYDVVTEIDCTSQQARLAIEQFFAGARPTDVHLLYLSCHGIQDAGGELYFAFTDTNRELPSSTGVSADWVRDRLHASRSRSTIVLIDCCFSGAFLRGMQAKSGTDANLGTLIRDLPEGAGVAVLTASGATEFSLEDAEGRAGAATRPSYFTEAVVTGIATGAADLNSDGRITVDELYRYVYQRILEGPSPQRPRRMDHGEGEVVVAEVHKRLTEPPLPPDPPQLDATLVMEAGQLLGPWPPLPATGRLTRDPPAHPPYVTSPAGPSAAASAVPYAEGTAARRPGPHAVRGRFRRPRRSWLRLVLIGMVVVGLVAGLAAVLQDRRGRENGLPATPGGECKARKLAVYATLASGTGVAVRNGAGLAVDEHNRDHAKCPVELVAVDEASGLADVESIAADSAVAGVIGGAFSTAVMTTQPVFEGAGVPTITVTATETGLGAHGWRTFLRAVGSNAAQVPGEARYLTTTLGSSRVYVVGEDSPPGRELADAMRQRLGDAAVERELLAPGASASDTMPLALRIRARAATAVYFAGGDRTAGALVRQLRESGVDAPFVMGSGWPCQLPIDKNQYSSSFMQQAGASHVERIVYTSTCLPTLRLPASFMASYRNKYGLDPIGYGGMAYDVATIFLSAIDAGADDRSAVIEWVRTHGGTGLGGPYRFGPNGECDLAVLPLWAFTVSNGRAQVSEIPTG
ncbi:MAG TPA: ABC transporter substrate-binding protein [Micromonosporaceae bacterium]|nr:ABC transporter substrate-binding protein [Micromonosporaceae bacterium]